MKFKHIPIILQIIDYPLLFQCLCMILSRTKHCSYQINIIIIPVRYDYILQACRKFTHSKGLCRQYKIQYHSCSNSVSLNVAIEKRTVSRFISTVWRCQLDVLFEEYNWASEHWVLDGKHFNIRLAFYRTRLQFYKNSIRLQMTQLKSSRVLFVGYTVVEIRVKIK